MEIEHITDPAMIATIIGMKDEGLIKNMLNPSGCSRAEWVQFLVDGTQIREGNHIRVFGIIEDGKIKGYTAAMNCVFPPMSRIFIIIYQSWKNVEQQERVKAAVGALEKIMEWSAENGCRCIKTTVRDEAMARLMSIEGGFKKTDEICMELIF